MSDKKEELDEFAIEYHVVTHYEAKVRAKSEEEAIKLVEDFPEDGHFEDKFPVEIDCISNLSQERREMRAKEDPQDA